MKMKISVYNSIARLTSHLDDTKTALMKLGKVLVKSKISNWWIADTRSKLAFVNVLSGKPLGKNLLVVGFINQSKQELATSRNRVVAVTQDGVLTAMGIFYPFETANKLYLHFLVEANRENTAIATNWMLSDDLTELTADIVKDGNVIRDITFDFTPDSEYDVMILGYSEKLDCNVVVTSFARRNVCSTGIPLDVKYDIFRSSYL